MVSRGLDERFVLLTPGALQEVTLLPSALGTSVSVKPRGLADDDAQSIERVATGEAMRPLSPIDLVAVIQSDGGLSHSWVRRSRLGWLWPAGTDLPLGESVERYRVVLEGSAGTLTFTPTEPQLVVPAEAVAGMSGTVTIEVVQVGDFAKSRPVTASVVI